MKQEDCCSPVTKNSSEKINFSQGILYGLLPHSFCIFFIIFSILGVTVATAFLKRFLLNYYFFPLLILISFIFAVLSAVIYLKRMQSLNLEGIKKHSRYLTVLFTTVIGINLLLYLIVFPAIANLGYSQKINSAISKQNNLSTKTIKVNVPCSGHAPLIINELEKVDGVVAVKYRLPNLFDITFNSSKTNLSKILKLPIFNSFKAQET